MELKLNRKNILWAVLILSILIKFVHISHPLFEGAMGRQIATAMMTKNIFKGGSIFYPELDIAPLPNYCMLEFPLYNIIVSVFYGVFGIGDIWGRLVSVISMLFATIFLFKIVRKHFNFDVAMLSAIIFNLSPISLIYGRSYQPDPMMICFIVAGFYFLDVWVDDSKWKYLIFSGMLFSCAFLIKIISLYVFLPVLFLFHYKDSKRFLFSLSFWIFISICLIPSLFWYLHARSVALSPQFYRATTYDTSVWDVFQRWIVPSYWLKLSSYKTFFKMLLGPLMTPIGGMLFLFGIIRRNENHRQLFFYVYMLSVTLFSFILLRKMDLEYYYLAYLPIVSVFIARGVDVFLNSGALKREFYVNRLSSLGILILWAAFTLLYSYRGYVVPEYLKYTKELSGKVLANTAKDELIISYAPVFYYADRKGFQFNYSAESIKRSLYVWKTSLENNSPEELLDFYIKRGGAVFADTLYEKEKKYQEFYDYMRKKFKVIDYEPGKYILVRVDNR